ncbi:Hypp8214 [Branchiostoma lanceolatum]|uniref:Hypp8214 protein n=1 Tax=Branchiostoma lanceolatum TaxID=7740 RepID=A0A8J9Z7J4_BRALA|nr:Hypp8214 [Branchiostoma lanceolatum]
MRKFGYALKKSKRLIVSTDGQTSVLVPSRGGKRKGQATRKRSNRVIPRSLAKLTLELIITLGLDLQEAVNWEEWVNAALSTDPQSHSESPGALQDVEMPSVGPAPNVTQEEGINPSPDVEMASVSASPDASQDAEMPSEGAAPDAMVEDIYIAPTVEFELGELTTGQWEVTTPVYALQTSEGRTTFGHPAM